MTEVQIIKRVVGAVAALFIVGGILGSFYTIEDGTVGVVSKFGEYNNEEATAGLHWKKPFIEEVHVMDIKMQTVNYKSAAAYGELASGQYLLPQISILDSKNLPIGIDLTLQYTPEKTEMAEILRTYGTGYFEKKINPVVRDVVRDVSSKYEAENIATQREEIGTRINAALREEFNQMPFILNNVALRGITLPTSVAQKVKEVQEAKQEEQRLGMMEKQAVVDKRIEIIKAEKVAEVNVTKAEGEARAIAVKANAQAKANQKVAASLTKLLVQQNQIERWNGTVPSTMLGDSNTGVLLNLTK